MFRILMAALLTLTMATIAQGQDAAAPASDRTATGGAQTLADIMARQRGEKVQTDVGSAAATNAGDAPGQLNTRGTASDPDLWRSLKGGTADVTASNNGPAATTLFQDGGMQWLRFREGPLSTYGSYLLGGTLLLLAIFYLLRGRIRIDGNKTGRKIERFKAFERFAHWMLAGSFILLGLTGLITLFGRKVIIPTFGHEAFATLAVASKWVHNNVSWAFMIALVMIFVMWVVHNLPDRTDIKWLLKGGGIFTKGHPPAKKFNAGQKLIFWSVILLGTSISVSGLALLFPFEINMFAATFAKLNAWGISGVLGLGELPTTLAPHEEMQFAQLWHAIVSFILMAIIFAHIYIGSVGMEGASDAMISGKVEEQWAREHHSLWVEEVAAKEIAAPKEATPAE